MNYPELKSIGNTYISWHKKKASRKESIASSNKSKMAMNYEKEVRETTKVFQRSHMSHDRGSLGGARQVHDLDIEMG